MTDEKAVPTEVLDNTTPTEDAVPTSVVEDIAKETINEVDATAVAADDLDDEEVTIENVEIPTEKKELTPEDHILRRKERQLEREHKKKRELIEQHHAEVERLRQENEEANKKLFAESVKSIQAPIRENFENEEDFIDSRVQYNLAKSVAERIRQEDQVHTAKLKEIFVEKLSKAEQNGQNKYHDFEEVVSDLGKPGVLTNKTLVDAIVDSDYAGDVFYILGKYPSIRQKLNGMEPIKAIKELAKLEQKFEQVIKAKKVVQPVKKIIEPITGGKGSAVKKPLEKYTDSELQNMSNREFTKIMKERSKHSTY